MEYNGIKINDIITTYHTGIYKLIGIERRFYTAEFIKVYYSITDKDAPNPGDELVPLFKYRRINLDTGELFETEMCDAGYCKQYLI